MYIIMRFQMDVFKGLSKADKEKRKKSAQPSFIKPMLATLTDTYFSSTEWIYEHKFDGERCLVVKKNGKVTLMSRNKKSKNLEYPELVKAFEEQKADNFIVDGEIITIGKEGVSDFQKLQQRINLSTESKIKEVRKKVKISLEIFDVMYADGYDIRDLTLLGRKSVLKNLLDFKGILAYTEHKTGDGVAYFKKACKIHWEGLIAKKSDSPYIGKRSTDWLKFKCIMKQELVIGGFTDPRGTRIGFGALLVGYYKDGKLHYAGKVGTGYSDDELRMLFSKLIPLETSTCYFSNYTESTEGVHWVKPELVAEFRFANWTKENRLRVGRFKGLRDDKDAKDVVKEVPKAISPIGLT